MSVWNVDSLKEHFESLQDEIEKRNSQRFLDTKTAVDAALAAAEKAVTKAEVATEKRLEGVNEFRKSLEDVGRLQMPRAEQEAINKGQDQKIDGIIARLDKTEGKGIGIGQALGWIIAAITIVGFLILKLSGK